MIMSLPPPPKRKKKKRMKNRQQRVLKSSQNSGLQVHSPGAAVSAEQNFVHAKTFSSDASAKETLNPMVMPHSKSDASKTAVALRVSDDSQQVEPVARSSHCSCILSRIFEIKAGGLLISGIEICSIIFMWNILSRGVDLEQTDCYRINIAPVFISVLGILLVLGTVFAQADSRISFLPYFFLGIVSAVLLMIISFNIGPPPLSIECGQYASTEMCGGVRLETGSMGNRSNVTCFQKEIANSTEAHSLINYSNSLKCSKIEVPEPCHGEDGSNYRWGSLYEDVEYEEAVSIINTVEILLSSSIFPDESDRRNCEARSREESERMQSLSRSVICSSFFKFCSTDGFLQQPCAEDTVCEWWTNFLHVMRDCDSKTRALVYETSKVVLNNTSSHLGIIDHVAQHKSTKERMMSLLKLYASAWDPRNIEQASKCPIAPPWFGSTLTGNCLLISEQKVNDDIRRSNESESGVLNLVSSDQTKNWIYMVRFLEIVACLLANWVSCAWVYHSSKNIFGAQENKAPPRRCSFSYLYCVKRRKGSNTIWLQTWATLSVLFGAFIISFAIYDLGNRILQHSYKDSPSYGISRLSGAIIYLTAFLVFWDGIILTIISWMRRDALFESASIINDGRSGRSSMELKVVQTATSQPSTQFSISVQPHQKIGFLARVRRRFMKFQSKMYQLVMFVVRLKENYFDRLFSFETGIYYMEFALCLEVYEIITQIVQLWTFSPRRSLWWVYAQSGLLLLNGLIIVIVNGLYEVSRRRLVQQSFDVARVLTAVLDTILDVCYLILSLRISKMNEFSGAEWYLATLSISTPALLCLKTMHEIASVARNLIITNLETQMPSNKKSISIFTKSMGRSSIVSLRQHMSIRSRNPRLANQSCFWFRVIFSLGCGISSLVTSIYFMTTATVSSIKCESILGPLMWSGSEPKIVIGTDHRPSCQFSSIETIYVESPTQYSSDVILEIPPVFSNMSSSKLRSLVFQEGHNVQSTGVPFQIFDLNHMPRLTKLQFGSSSPASTSLDFAKQANLVTEIPNKLIELLPNLRELNFSGSDSLVSVPTSISKLRRMSMMDLSGSGVKYISPRYLLAEDRPKLLLNSAPISKRLDWNYDNDFKTFFDNDMDINWLPLQKALPHLEELQLAGNKFTTIPAAVAFFSNLRILNLSSNLIHGNDHKSLFDKVSSLPHLQDLDLRNNVIAALPFAIDEMSCKTMQFFQNDSISIHVENNKITGVFYRVDNLHAKTKCLSASKNFISQTASSIIRRILPELMYVEFIYLRANGHSCLSLKNIFAAADPNKLVRLILLCPLQDRSWAWPSGSRLSMFQNLITLGVDGEFGQVPHEIYSLTSLVSLGLRSMSNWSISSQISRLGKLTELRIATGKAVTIPSEISKLHKLRVLDFTGSRNLQFPIPNLKSISQLQVFTLCGSHLNFSETDLQSSLYHGQLELPCNSVSSVSLPFHCCRMRSKDSLHELTASSINYRL